MRGDGPYRRLMAGRPRDGADGVIGDGARRRGGRRDGDAPAPTATRRTRRPRSPTAILTRGGPRAGGSSVRILLGLVAGYRGSSRSPSCSAWPRGRVHRRRAWSARWSSRGQERRAVRRFLVALLVVAPLAGVLHWLESWLAHDMAYRLLAEMRLRPLPQARALAPAYLLARARATWSASRPRTSNRSSTSSRTRSRRRSWPCWCPRRARHARRFGWPLALALLPFLAYAGAQPVARARAHRSAGVAGARGLGELSAHVGNRPGAADLVAFQHDRARGAAFMALAHAPTQARACLPRRPRAPDGALEVATGLGGLAYARRRVSWRRAARAAPAAAAHPARRGRVPAGVGDRAGRPPARRHSASTRRLHVVHREPVPVTDGPGSPARARGAAAASSSTASRFTYPGPARARALDVSLRGAGRDDRRAGRPSGAGKTTVANLLLRFWDPDAGRSGSAATTCALTLDGLRRRDRAGRAGHLSLQRHAGRTSASPGRRPPSAELAAAIERAALAEFVRRCRRGSRRGSASAACSSPAASASGWRSRARS